MGSAIIIKEEMLCVVQHWSRIHLHINSSTIVGNMEVVDR